MIKVLFLGDVVGEAGLDAVRLLLPILKQKYDPDLTIVNGENASKGKGLLEKDYKHLLYSGADVITLGNHYRSKKQIDDYIDDAEALIRPYNLKGYEQGQGYAEFEINGSLVRVINMLGTAFMKEEVLDPIASMEKILEEEEDAITIVDYHAESTSEKKIFSIYFDGKISASIGTHTHVQTNDLEILEGGTLHISDAGMCGSKEGVLGFSKESVIKKVVLNEKDAKFETIKEGKKMVNGIYFEIDEYTHRCLNATLIKEVRQ